MQLQHNLHIHAVDEERAIASILQTAGSVFLFVRIRSFSMFARSAVLVEAMARVGFVIRHLQTSPPLVPVGDRRVERSHLRSMVENYDMFAIWAMLRSSRLFGKLRLVKALASEVVPIRVASHVIFHGLFEGFCSGPSF